MNDEFGLSLEREIDDLRSGALLGHVTHGANPPVGPMCLGNRRVVSSAIIGLTFAGLYLALTSNSEFTDLTASQLVVSSMVTRAGRSRAAAHARKRLGVQRGLFPQ
jgi:hypothetical protein